jgi:hypothetical protein
VPAALLLGEAHLKAGEPREALRVWERAAEGPQPALPVLSRIEQLHRSEGRPTRMISLYQDALARQPDNLALAFGLGRVYFELAMLDEAAEQFQKMEVSAPELPLIHAYLGAILERRGQFHDALEAMPRRSGRAIASNGRIAAPPGRCPRPLGRPLSHLPSLEHVLPWVALFRPRPRRRWADNADLVFRRSARCVACLMWAGGILCGACWSAIRRIRPPLSRLRTPVGSSPEAAARPSRWNESANRETAPERESADWGVRGPCPGPAFDKLLCGSRRTRPGFDHGGARLT